MLQKHIYNEIKKYIAYKALKPLKPLIEQNILLSIKIARANLIFNGLHALSLWKAPENLQFMKWSTICMSLSKQDIALFSFFLDYNFCDITIRKSEIQS